MLTIDDPFFNALRTLSIVTFILALIRQNAYNLLRNPTFEQDQVKMMEVLRCLGDVWHPAYLVVDL